MDYLTCKHEYVMRERVGNHLNDVTSCEVTRSSKLRKRLAELHRPIKKNI